MHRPDWIRRCSRPWAARQRFLEEMNPRAIRHRSRLQILSNSFVRFLRTRHTIRRWHSFRCHCTDHRRCLMRLRSVTIRPTRSRHLTHHRTHHLTRRLMHRLTRHLMHRLTRHLMHRLTRHLMHRLTRHLMHRLTHHLTRHLTHHRTHHLTRHLMRHLTHHLTRHLTHHLTRHLTHHLTHHLKRRLTRHLKRHLMRHLKRRLMRHLRFAPHSLGARTCGWFRSVESTQRPRWPAFERHDQARSRAEFAYRLPGSQVVFRAVAQPQSRRADSDTRRAWT
jgi:uncharacterized membrane protein YheB (UPF0754 family)